MIPVERWKYQVTLIIWHLEINQISTLNNLSSSSHVDNTEFPDSSFSLSLSLYIYIYIHHHYQVTLTVQIFFSLSIFIFNHSRQVL